MKKLKRREVKDLPLVTQPDAVGSGLSWGPHSWVPHLSKPHLQKEEASQAQRKELGVSKTQHYSLSSWGGDKIWSLEAEVLGWNPSLGSHCL